MYLADKIEGGKRIPILHRERSPILIVGKKFSTELLQTLFLFHRSQSGGASYFGNVENILPRISRPLETVLFERDFDRPRSFNPLERVPEDKRSEIADYCLEAFHAAWPSNIPTPLLDNNLLAAFLAMLSIPSGTLYAARHLFTSSTYRSNIIGKLKDLELKHLWQAFHDLDDREQYRQAQSVMNRLLVLTADPGYRGIIGQTKSFELNDKDTLLADLPDTTRGHLIAALLMARLAGPIFIQSPHVFVGAGQPIIACEYLGQLPERLRARLIATATLIAFRVGVKDAKVLKPELNLRDGDFALTDLPQGYCYVRQETTELAVMPDIQFPQNYRAARIIRNRSRSDQYSQPRSAVEAKLENFLKNLEP